MKERDERFALRFWGALKIDTAGEYFFANYADAGSNFYIDNNCIIYNDGVHAFGTYATGSAVLNKGCYPIHLDYFQDTGASGLTLYYEGPGIVRKKIPGTAFFCDSSVTVRVRDNKTAQNLTALPVQIRTLSRGRLMVAVAFNTPYTLSIIRLDGKIIKNIRGKKADTHYFTRPELKPGAYLVRIHANGQNITRSIVLP
jgi:hypothetical protein